MSKTWIYIIIMAGVTYLIRVLPLTLIRKPIENRFIKSFLYYVPYVTLAAMTFPAIVEATTAPLAGIAALAVGVILAWRNTSMVMVASICCFVVLAVEFVLI